MNNQVSYSPNFGMALYAPTQKKIAKVLGKEVATEFEKVRPALEKIANGVDIEECIASVISAKLDISNFFPLISLALSSNDCIPSLLPENPNFRLSNIV